MQQTCGEGIHTGLTVAYTIRKCVSSNQRIVGHAEIESIDSYSGRSEEFVKQSSAARRQIHSESGQTASESLDIEILTVYLSHCAVGHCHHSVHQVLEAGCRMEVESSQI